MGSHSYNMGSGASKAELVSPGEVFDKLDEEIKSGVEKLSLPIFTQLVTTFHGKPAGGKISAAEQEELERLYHSFEQDYQGRVWVRDVFLSLLTQSQSGVLSREQSLQLAFRLFLVGTEDTLEMKDAKDLWSRFDIYETTQDHMMEKNSERINEEMFLKKSMARLENINLQHKM